MSDDDVPIVDYVNHIHQELQGEMDRRFAEQREAAARVAADLTQRLGAMNEFRAAMSDIASTKVSRDMFDSYVSTQERRIRNTEDRLALVETSEQADSRKIERGHRERQANQQDYQGKQAFNQYRVLIIGVVIAVLTVIVDVLVSLHVH